MTREEFLRSKEYWMADIRMKMFQVLTDYMKENNLNQKEFAQILGVTGSRVTFLLNKEPNHTTASLVELAMVAGKVPVITFVDLEKYIKKDRNKWKQQK